MGEHGLLPVNAHAACCAALWPSPLLSHPSSSPPALSCLRLPCPAHCLPPQGRACTWPRRLRGTTLRRTQTPSMQRCTTRSSQRSERQLGGWALLGLLCLQGRGMQACRLVLAVPCAAAVLLLCHAPPPYCCHCFSCAALPLPLSRPCPLWRCTCGLILCCRGERPETSDFPETLGDALAAAQVGRDARGVG